MFSYQQSNMELTPIPPSNLKNTEFSNMLPMRSLEVTMVPLLSMQQKIFLEQQLIKSRFQRQETVQSI